MTAQDSAPRGFSDWLELLRQQGIGQDFEEKTASWLRVIAATKNSAVILATGTEAIPYIDWVWDGMSMSSRLILHNQSGEVAELMRPHFSTDIRVATHQQNLVDFLSDIEAHRFDFIIVDLDDTELDPVSTLLERLSEHGLLICLGTTPKLDELIRAHGDSHFSSMISETGRCAILVKKGLQHRAVRRGGRRRHEQAGGSG